MRHTFTKCASTLHIDRLTYAPVECGVPGLIRAREAIRQGSCNAVTSAGTSPPDGLTAEFAGLAGRKSGICLDTVRPDVMLRTKRGRSVGRFRPIGA